MSEVIGIGAAPRRKEDLRFLTGRGNYVADIERPGTVFGVFVRSPHAHARIKSIDPRAALALPGVLAVFTGADLKADGVNGLPCGWGIKGNDGQPMQEPPHPAMAQDKVRYVGDAVAFVVAESLRQARNADDALVVDYNVFPAVVGVADALKPDAALVYDDVPSNLCCDWDLGDKAATEAAFNKAAHIARINLVNNRLVGNPMEPRAAIAEFHPETGHYTLWSTSQFPHVVRLLMGLFVLNIPQQRLRVVAPDVGGGFGVKQFHYAEEAVVTWACRKVGRPIKVVFTNTVPVDAYRGAGRPEATFVLERLVDIAATRMGIDRVEIRRRNMIPKEAYPYQTPVMMRYDSGDPKGCLAKAMNVADWAGFVARKEQSARQGKLRGIGISTYVEACGLAPSRIAGQLGARGGLYESATVRVHPTGQVTVLIGTHNHGQGHETTFAQIVGEKLGVPFENIDIVFGDTDKVQFGMGTYGSRSLVVGGP